MKQYRDRDGREIKIGDVIVYDEGEGLAQSINEVVEHDGEMADVIRVGCPEWSVIVGERPVELKYGTGFLYGDDMLAHSRVVDVPHKTAFTPEYAESVFGRSTKELKRPVE